MKYFILILTLFAGFGASAQTVTELPTGKYEAKMKAAQSRWEKGDLVIVSDSEYKLTSGGEAGEYKISVAAQRIFFTSGPLKSAFAKLGTANGKPVIIFPTDRNKELGITEEMWASKQ